VAQVAPLPLGQGVAQCLVRVCYAPASLVECHTRPDQGKQAIPQEGCVMLQFTHLGDNLARLSLLSTHRGMGRSS